MWGGAYYAASLTIFERNTALEIIDKGCLNFFQGVAEGPAYGVGQFEYESEKGAQQTNIMLNASTIKAGSRRKNLQFYFNGGPYFHSFNNQNNLIIATYADLPGDKAAVVKTTFGLGQVVLSGIHLEYDWHEQPNSTEWLWVKYIFSQLGVVRVT